MKLLQLDAIVIKVYVLQLYLGKQGCSTALSPMSLC